MFSVPGDGTATSTGLLAMRWFMRNDELTSPECTVFYRDDSMRTFGPKDFRPDRISRVRLRRALALSIVAGLTEEDDERVSVSYAVGGPSVIISFPSVWSATAEAEHLIERFREEMKLSEK